MAFFKVDVLIRNGALADLKGAPLSCLMALAAHAGKGKEPYPSVECLCRETLYCKPIVCKALDWLEKHGHIEVQRRQHKSSLYTITSALFGFSQSKDSLLSGSQSKENELPEVLKVKILTSQSKENERSDSLPKEDTNKDEEDPDPEVPSADVVSRETPSATGSAKPLSEKLACAAGCAWCLRPIKETEGTHYLLQQWHNRFKDAFGQCPTLQAGRDGNLLKALSRAGRTDEEIAAAMTVFFETADDWTHRNGLTVGVFGKRIDSLRAPKRTGFRPGSNLAVLEEILHEYEAEEANAIEQS